MLHFLPLADDADHLAYVRAQGCAVRLTRDAGCRCSKSIEAYRLDGAGSVGLCRRHYRALHDLGRSVFEQSYGLNLSAIAARLRGDRHHQQQQPNS